VSTSGPGGGQEMTPLTFMSTLVHHGFIFVPFGYASGFAKLVSLTELHGGKSQNRKFFSETIFDTGIRRVPMGSWDICWDNRQAHAVQARARNSRAPRFGLLRDRIPRPMEIGFAKNVYKFWIKMNHVS
jgi:hypothetical protein